MKITLLQTCDTKVYTPFLEITSRTFRAYAARNDIEYDCYIGLKRGSMPWHASLNRIVLLADMARQGYNGWVIYADADAYVADLSFNLREYLESKKEFAFIGAPSGVQPPSWWDLNIGVFAINLGHLAGRKIAFKWEEKLYSVSEEDLNNEKRWGEVVDDQELLQSLFREFEEFKSFIFIDDCNPATFNWDARFIKQVIREHGNHSVRINKLSRAVDDVLSAASIRDIFNKEQFYEELSIALYETLLCRRPDEGGLKYSTESLLNGSHTIKDQMYAIINSEEFSMRLPEILKIWRVSYEASDKSISRSI